MPELIDRKQVKAQARSLMREAQVPAAAFFALYLVLYALIDIAASLVQYSSQGETLLSDPPALFAVVLSNLLIMVLGVGTYLYCMTVRSGARAEYLTLFDGFSFAGKIILLELAMLGLVIGWSMLFLIPGIIAVYRYRFALWNLCDNPSIGVLEALALSRQQSQGYKLQLFRLDLSFLGWIVLANLPAYYLNLAYTLRAYAEIMPELSFPTLPIPGIGSVAELLVTDIVYVAVSLLYLPRRTCCDLLYFETAQRTAPAVPPRPSGPDGI